MGATSQPYIPRNLADWMKQKVTWETAERSYTCRAVSIVDRVAGYAAVECKDKQSGDIHVFAAVFSFKFHPRAADGMQFTYKLNEESSSPLEAAAPQHILDQLTLTDNEYALAWRERCRKRLANRERARIEPGTVVKFNKLLTFTSGNSYSTFIFEKRSTFVPLSEVNGYPAGRVRIPNWRNFSDWEAKRPGYEIALQKALRDQQVASATEFDMADRIRESEPTFPA